MGILAAINWGWVLWTICSTGLVLGLIYHLEHPGHPDEHEAKK